MQDRHLAVVARVRQVARHDREVDVGAADDALKMST